MTSYAENTLSSSLRFLADSQAAISNNIANATTAGYKRHTPIAQEAEVPFYSLLDRTLPSVDYVEATDFTAGSQRAADKMNVALGEGQFFRVEDNTGSFYTRRGELIVSGTGQLVTPNGQRYLDVAGQPLQVGEASDLRIASNGEVRAVFNNEERLIGQLGVYRVDNPEDRLGSVGGSLFADRSGNEPVLHSNPSIRQGYTEESNVEVLSELISMINVQRSFDATTRAIQTVDRIQSSFAQALSR